MSKEKLPTMFYLWHTIIHLCHIILSFPWLKKRLFNLLKILPHTSLQPRVTDPVRNRGKAPAWWRSAQTSPCPPHFINFHSYTCEGAELYGPSWLLNPGSSLPPPTRVPSPRPAQLPRVPCAIRARLWAGPAGSAGAASRRSLAPRRPARETP